MSNVRKLGLGTVQWGLSYGVTNTSGVTPPESVSAILAEARHRGIEILDTASLYGDAESALGANSLDKFRVVTKTPKFDLAIIGKGQSDRLVEVFHQSLSRLKSAKVYGLLSHHAPDLIAPGGAALVAAMQDLKEKGFVEKVGVSVYDGEQVDALLKVFKPDIVQLPFSVLDQRMLVNGQLERLKNLEVEIHVRSVFLQGLLLMPPPQVPAYFSSLTPLLEKWHTAAKESGATPRQAALAFVRDIPYIDTVLVGVENLSQFQECVEDFSAAVDFDASNLACNEPMFVNPALWRV